MNPAERSPSPDDGRPEVSLRRWSDGDFEVLDRSNTPEMTAFLGGPESAAQLERLHRNFLRRAVRPG